MNKWTLAAFAMIFAACLLVGCITRYDGYAGTIQATNEQASTTGNYASVNGLTLYYEIHGAAPTPSRDIGPPLVLLHGALTTIDISFGEVLPIFAETRQVIAIEQQGHGHTADVDRPLTYEQMADDTVAILHQLGIEEADFFGWSMGGSIALEIAIRYPEMVNRLVIASIASNQGGIYPELLESIPYLTPEAFAGSEWERAYAESAPNPEDWPTLIAKVQQLTLEFEGWTSEDIETIDAPTLVIIGDSDNVRPEHAAEMFRLLGGGVVGDIVGLPASQLAVLPGTTHVMLVERPDWLVSMIIAFLDAPMPQAK